MLFSLINKAIDLTWSIKYIDLAYDIWSMEATRVNETYRYNNVTSIEPKNNSIAPNV